MIIAVSIRLSEQVMNNASGLCPVLKPFEQLLLFGKDLPLELDDA